VTSSDVDNYTLQVCVALLSENQAEATKLAETPLASELPAALREELGKLAGKTPTTWVSTLIRMTYYLPAWVQFVGQRLILISPRLSRWVLRKTGIHHRWY
jgi:hypothetical protein